MLLASLKLVVTFGQKRKFGIDGVGIDLTGNGDLRQELLVTTFRPKRLLPDEGDRDQTQQSQNARDEEDARSASP